MKVNIKSAFKTLYYTSQHKLYSINNYYRAIAPSSMKIKTFINTKNLSSPTEYLIWVDTTNFKINVFRGAGNNWILTKSYLCTIGKPSTPTPKGFFKVGIKGDSFGENKGYLCKYYTQFKGNYLFHSILYNLDGSIRDGRLGEALSDGCIRLATDNAKWIWDNIPENTTVYIT